MLNDARLRDFLTDWRLLWFLLLLPVALWLPATPIDETRYIAVAWEMRVRGDFLIPHLNGAIYSEKTPLFFWLMNLDWLLVGIHVWAVRLSVLAVTFVSLLLFEKLAFRLSAVESLARNATLIFAGTIFVALFSDLIMFDVLLAACVLLAFHGLLDLDALRLRRGVALLAAGLGLGLLTKGPPTLLYILLPAVLAPWWSITARTQKLRWYGFVALGTIGGAIIMLAWVVPWALVLGKENFDAILLHQTVGRIAKSFAHQRPAWWYLMVLPFMLLPWTLCVRAPWRTWIDALHTSKTTRFAVVWFVPTFVVFCFVSGKQPHYMLPLLAAVALYFAQLLEDRGARISAALWVAALAVVGVALSSMSFLATHAATLPITGEMVRSGMLTPASLTVFAQVWPLWGLLIVAVAAGLIWMRSRRDSVKTVALSSVAGVAIAMLALTQGAGAGIDVSAVANRIRADQESGTPVAHLGWHHGLFEFAGRLTEPLPALQFGELYDWCAAHPSGEVLTFYSKYKLAAAPIETIPYRLGSKIQIWRARDILASPRPQAPSKPDDDDTPDE